MPDRKPAIAWDTETHRFTMGLLVPPLSCAGFGTAEGVRIGSQADPAHLRHLVVEGLFQSASEGYQVVAHHAAFDLAVVATQWPDLMPHIFQGLEDGVFEDTALRDKFLHLAEHGDLDFYTPNEGCKPVKLNWSLEALSNRWLGKSRKEQKEGEDSWRTNYAELEHLPPDQWPDEARNYLIEDVADCLAIRDKQEDERFRLIEAIEVDPFASQDFRMAVSFSLYLMSAWGFKVDGEKLLQIEAELAKELTADKMVHLVSSGILRSAVPSMITYSKKGKPRTLKGKKESINNILLAEHVTQVAATRGIELSYTAKAGKVEMGMDFFKDHADKDVIFGEYYRRQKLQKLVTTELPRLKWNGVPTPVIHPGYDYLKRTGRISSQASSKYPSFNVQNVDPRVRGCIVPRDGFLLFSIDYTGMELGTTAQVCYSLFGHSVMREKINANIDLHAYLGSQLAYNLSDEFRNYCDDNKISDTDLVYAEFAKCKESKDPEEVKFFKHWRKFAKPTGLGFPGGLGPKTFIDFAKSPYDVIVDLEQAKQLREIWKVTYPEMVDYFKHIESECGDKYCADKFAYTSPYGMYRAGCDYCAVANGMALQTPSAEGALTSVFNAIRACYDPTMGSFLYGGSTRPIAFVHDEIVGEVWDDGYAHDRVYEIARIMVESMRMVTPDVTPRAQPCLMRRWDKDAVAVYDANGRLTVWEPKKK